MNFKKILRDPAFFISISLFSLLGFWCVCSRPSANGPSEEHVFTQHNDGILSSPDPLEMIQGEGSGQEYLEYIMGFYNGATERKKLSSELTEYFSKLQHDFKLEAFFSGFQSGFKSQKSDEDLASLETWLMERRKDLHREVDQRLASEWQKSVLAEKDWEVGFPGCLAYRCSSATLKEAIQEPLKSLHGSEENVALLTKLPEGEHRFSMSPEQEQLQPLMSSALEAEQVIQLLTSQICYMNRHEKVLLNKEVVSRALENWLAILMKNPESSVEIKLRTPLTKSSFTFFLKYHPKSESEVATTSLKTSEAPVMNSERGEEKVVPEAPTEEKPLQRPSLSNPEVSTDEKKTESQ